MIIDFYTIAINYWNDLEKKEITFIVTLSY